VQFFEKILKDLYKPIPIDYLIGQHAQYANRKKNFLSRRANVVFFLGADCMQSEVAYSVSSSSLATKEP